MNIGAICDRYSESVGYRLVSVVPIVFFVWMIVLVFFYSIDYFMGDGRPYDFLWMIDFYELVIGFGLYVFMASSVVDAAFMGLFCCLSRFVGKRFEKTFSWFLEYMFVTDICGNRHDGFHRVVVVLVSSFTSIIVSIFFVFYLLE